MLMARHPVELWSPQQLPAGPAFLRFAVSLDQLVTPLSPLSKVPTLINASESL